MTRVETKSLGVHLERTPDDAARIDALAELLGGRAGLLDVADNLKFRARESLLGKFGGRAVERALTWNEYDRRDPVWWPQGITTSADATVTGRWRGRRLAITTWYAKPQDGRKRGSRLSVLDLDTLRYRHVLLVAPGTDDRGRPQFSPLTIHAGGVVWTGEWIHVAATRRGFISFHVDDVLRVPDDNRDPTRIGVQHTAGAGPRVTSYGHHYVLPARFSHRAFTDEGHEPLRYSFLSLDRSSTPQHLVAGEYGRGKQTTRLTRYHLDPGTGLPVCDESGRSAPVQTTNGVAQMQGAVTVGGRLYLSVSRGPFLPGSLLTGTSTGTGTGASRSLRQHWFAQPIGPEDLTYSGVDDRIWAVSEHPRRRWVYSMRRSWFEREATFDRRPQRGRRAS